MESINPVIRLQGPDCRPARLLIDEGAASPVKLAAQDVAQDARDATGQAWGLGEFSGTLPQDPFVAAGVFGESRVLKAGGWESTPEVSAIKGLWDAFVICPVEGGLVVAGSNARGVMYGLYKLSESLFGTDPMKAFSDILPDQMEVVEWAAPSVSSGEPRFKFRGIFINDEDALMSWRGEAEDGHVAPEVHAMIIESLCRLGGNMLAPPMWAGYMDDASRKLVEERGLFYTASHLEVLLSNPQNYWDAWCRKKFGNSLPYSFSSYPDELVAYWRDSVRRHRQYTNIWPVGLRGVTDCALWESDPDAPTDMRGRARLVSSAIRKQAEILAEECGQGEVVMSLTMRDEVLGLFETGELDLPENVILVWDDLARKSAMRNLPGVADREKNSRHGAYYHLNFCQDPRMQYLPAHILTHEIHRIIDSGATEYLLFNAGNVREISLLLKWGMTLSWNPDPYTETSDGAHILVRESVARTYGEELADSLTSLYEDVLETEYRFRVSQVTDCVAPLITSRELYDIWDNVSALDWIEEKGSVASVSDFAKNINFDNLPDRCWCFDPDQLPEFLDQWKKLLARADSLAGLVPERTRPFFESNLRVQIITSLSFCEWAIEILQGFRLCAENKFGDAAGCFENGSIALERLEAARLTVSKGKWENWFRGEYSNVFKKSLWTLKPRWHAEDTRRLSELLR